MQIHTGMLHPRPRLSMGLSRENQSTEALNLVFNIVEVGNRMKIYFLILKKQMAHQIIHF